MCKYGNKSQVCTKDVAHPFIQSALFGQAKKHNSFMPNKDKRPMGLGALLNNQKFKK